MSQPVGIPANTDEITPDWLSRAVSTRFPNSRADTVEVIDAHSGTTGRVRLRVRWNPESDAPEHLFGKLPPTDPIQRQMVAFTDMGRREARFYAEVAADMPIRVPAPIWSQGSTDDPQTYFMLLEDLADGDCRFPSSRDDDADRSDEGMMDTLAGLHGHFWQSPRFATDLAWIEAPMRSRHARRLSRTRHALRRAHRGRLRSTRRWTGDPDPR